MSSITFDHTKDKLSLAMDISQEHYEEIQEKTKNYSKLLLEENDDFKKSNLAQKIAEELSYKELVFFSTSFVILTSQMAKEGLKKLQNSRSMGSFGSPIGFHGKAGSLEDLLKMLKGLQRPDKDSDE